eukprot:TRINITY_DN5815_c0_g1_i1.p1 TRINITY_DN5815_c0_g1~~TRINITY_DN5815_c0_g1_i1.p1  ORF type:complete len:320 (+),score=57.17 TRINITY_DN5815_c0_g1_i1:828-1787(+)
MTDLPRVLSIQSHVVCGYVGNKCATYVHQQLGVELDTINSVQFSNHTGYPVFKGTVTPNDVVASLYAGLKANHLNTYTHFLSGYMGSENTLKAVMDIYHDLKLTNPDLKYACDPAMADDGKLYASLSMEMVESYKKLVLPHTDYLFPNQTECELLIGRSIQSEEEALKAIDELHTLYNIPNVIISSCTFPNDDPSKIVVLGSEKLPGSTTALRCRYELDKIPESFTGTGDLFASLVLANTVSPDVSGTSLSSGVHRTLVSLQHILKKTVERKAQRNAKQQRELSLFDRLNELDLLSSRDFIRNPVGKLEGKEWEQTIDA